MIFEYSSLSQEQQDQLAEICKLCIQMSNKARREGILALEEVIGTDQMLKNDDKRYLFITTLMRLVVDGTDAAVIKDIAENYTASSCKDEYDNLCFRMITTAVLCIQDGTNQRIMAEKFLSYIGIEHAGEFAEKIEYDRDDW